MFPPVINRTVAASAALALAVTVLSVAARSQVSPPPPGGLGRRMPVPPRVQFRRWSDTSSGPAALGTVLNAYGRRLSAAQLEQIANAVGRRAALTDLENGARSARFQARSLDANLVGLALLPLPAIAEWADGEFRVFISTRGASVEVYDPTSGSRQWFDAPALLGAWTGRLLLLNPLSV
jgi:ABC-type bacteriocin/lantibiotic exporter with double-glycine peptidase domain